MQVRAAPRNRPLGVEPDALGRRRDPQELPLGGFPAATHADALRLVGHAGRLLGRGSLFGGALRRLGLLGGGLARLRIAMNELPEADREIIELRHHGGMSFKQMSELLEEPLGTLLARHHRALRKLKQLMGETGD